jgi:hypothetical protein
MAKRKIYNYALFFRGWAQCRLATDPDPDYEPRGVSGYTFALPGEPDMTQIVYFQNGPEVIQRSFCPEIGVKVEGGYEFETMEGGPAHQSFLNRTKIEPGHPVFGAKVDLLGNPRFDSRNSTLVYNGYGVMNPFNLQVSNGPRSVSRRFYVDPKNPTDDLHGIKITDLQKYTVSTDLSDIPDISNPSANPLTATAGSPNMLLESGVLDAVAYRKERLKNLEGELAQVLADSPRDKIAIAALNKRIFELRIDEPVNRRTQQMSTKVLLPYALNSEKAMLNSAVIPGGKPWSLEMWMGSWDADSLAFYVLGTVIISLPKKLF